jgi:hypothetical protein
VKARYGKSTVEQIAMQASRAALLFLFVQAITFLLLFARHAFERRFSESLSLPLFQFLPVALETRRARPSADYQPIRGMMSAIWISGRDSVTSCTK